MSFCKCHPKWSRKKQGCLARKYRCFGKSRVEESLGLVPICSPSGGWKGRSPSQCLAGAACGEQRGSPLTGPVPGLIGGAVSPLTSSAGPQIGLVPVSLKKKLGAERASVALPRSFCVANGGVRIPSSMPLAPSAACRYNTAWPSRAKTPLLLGGVGRRGISWEN